MPKGENLDSLTLPPRVLSGDFAGWLRDQMAARRMTPRMLAVRAGLDHTTIYRLAVRQRQPSLASAVAIIRALASDRARGPFLVESGDEAEEAVAEAG